MSKTNKKTQNNQRKGGNQNSKSMKNKQKPSKRSQGQQRFGKQASVAAAYATKSEGRAPKIQASRDTCNIKHREFIGNVTGSTLFQIALALSVNPGLQTTFPWLSVMAQAWEQYKFRKLRFVFLTRTGSTTAGSVLMSPDYDSSDAPPSSEQVMSTYEGTVEDAPWKDNACNLKVSLLSGAGGPRKFVRTGALQPNQDIKLYDVANMFIGTVDGTSVAWGKLWVEYDIDFFVPQLPPTGIVANIGGKVNSGGVVSNANPLGDNPQIDAQASGFVVDNLSNVILSNAGTYLITAKTSTGVGLTDMTLTAGASTIIPNLGPSIINSALTSQQRIFQVICSAAGGSFNFSVQGTSSTVNLLYITFVPPGSVN